MTNINLLNKLMIDFLSQYMFSNRDYFNNNKNSKRFDPKLIIKNTISKKYGICMDLNYTFSYFLTKYGFDNYLVKAYEQNRNGKFYDIYHLTVIVNINGKKYLADVGFGEFFTEPVLLKNNTQTDKIHVETQNVPQRDDMVYDLSIDNKLIIRVFDNPITDINDIDHNYQNFYKTKPQDFPLCRKLYERIYNPQTKKYMIPKKIEKNYTLDYIY
ncbi:hypothetical protein QJ854_gp834 [Moumouvirus goulette]|uniref:Acetyltransferase n=1 Tax=Moumouvirus goulette TaxID=1247379 RepID=M1PG53_9VIRU|nr:hypothetical protein QJ854_gp834 [Moumouvirus goulette]AGF84948.1 hypothetical protein glt_00139 [Moumouvirus goulette]